MVEVIPTDLSLHPKNLNEIKVNLDKVLGLVKKVQIDLIDGKYADNKTWPFIDKNSDDLLKLERGEEVFPHINDFIMEADLLVLHPIEYIPDLLSIGFKSFVIHIDSTDHIDECIETIKNAGARVGLGIKPSTDSSLLYPYLAKIDFVQFMGNNRVGHSGVELDKNVVDKIKKFREKHGSIPIQVDIGVNFETAPMLVGAGVNGLVAGSAIYQSENIKDAIIKLRSF